MGKTVTCKKGDVIRIGDCVTLTASRDVKLHVKAPPDKKISLAKRRRAKA